MTQLIFIVLLLVVGGVMLRFAGIKLEEFYLDPRRRGLTLAGALVLQAGATLFLLIGLGEFLVGVARAIFA